MAISQQFESFDDALVDEDTFLADVLSGLGAADKSLPCKYFYDEEGSQLFDSICDSPQYYPTRTELKIMESSVDEMAKAIGPQAELIEYGSGASRKVRLLLDELEAPAAYVAVDISRDFLIASSSALSEDYPELAVHVICADFTKPFKLPAGLGGPGRRPVGYFPGSTIGNFDRPAAADFLANCVATLGKGGGLLIGVDLKKDPAILNAAYNDVAGITEAFNLNLLVRINRELDASFDMGKFAHVAFYDEDHGRIEMHIESLAAQTVTVGDREFSFAKGEHIHTENSYKYDIEEFQALAAKAGFSPVQVWTDPDRLFSVHFLEVPA
ncbi:MAG: L-histidine N(alpha)-methyltransferase [Rhodospirillaceae bacterium]|nr:L-histidine N(alpha)-methyltransferase [Rhodospirillaceae bacterium]HAA92396.1 L-histidine N(alpha)-methyltransferase [Rhodospirillaceae bacterium]